MPPGSGQPHIPPTGAQFYPFCNWNFGNITGANVADFGKDGQYGLVPTSSGLTASRLRPNPAVANC
jgi:hypothetical protein